MTLKEYIKRFGTGTASAVLKSQACNLGPEARAQVDEIADALESALENAYKQIKHYSQE